jgi:hypothetical protein
MTAGLKTLLNESTVVTKLLETARAAANKTILGCMFD